jgi:hypothetical protein
MHFLEDDDSYFLDDYISVDINLQRIYYVDVNKVKFAKGVCGEIIRYMRYDDDDAYNKIKSLLFIEAGISIIYKECKDPCIPDVFSFTIRGLINFYDELMALIYRDESCMSSGGADCPFRKKEMDERTPEENTMEVTIKTNPDQEKEKELDSLLQSIEL